MALLERNDFQRVQQNKGRFCSYLLSALNHYLSDARDRATAQKRGGRSHTVSIDWSAAEERFSFEPQHEMDPERLFARAWALTLLDEVRVALETEYVDGGRGALYRAISGALTADGVEGSYREIGARIGMGAGAVKVSVHRLRKRYREILEAEVTETIADPSGVESEIRDLMEALGGLSS